MTHILWTNKAFSELEVLPEEFAFELIRRTDLLASFPEMGALLESSFPELKELRQIVIKRKWRVVYDFDEFENTIYVLAVQNCRQKIPPLRDLQRRKHKS